MNFRFIHLYHATRNAAVETSRVLSELAKYFPYSPIDVRPGDQFAPEKDADLCRSLERIQVKDTKKPLRHQPLVGSEFYDVPLYDGWELLEVLATRLPHSEPSPDHIHLIISDILPVTFDYDDYRYHARSILCSSPSLVSMQGIVRGPARPRRYYFDLMRGIQAAVAEEEIKGRFLTDGDSRLSPVVSGLGLQAIFYTVMDGVPFCEDVRCRLFNAHWQEELIHSQVHTDHICDRHSAILEAYNAKAALFEKK